MASRDPRQVRYLRRRLLRTLLLRLFVFTAAFFLVVIVFDRFFASDLGQWVADTTSEWTVYEPSGDGGESEQGVDAAGGMVTQDRSLSELATELSLAHPDTVWDIQTNPVDGTIWVRDLTVYQTLHDLWLPAAIVLFAIGCLAIVSLTLRKSLSYFDELESAVEGLLEDRERELKLSRDLHLTEGALNALRERTLAAERAGAEAERRKSELVAYLAHDIRTPLTSIVGYQHLLLETPPEDEALRRRYTEITLEKSEDLNALVEELFDITRLNLSALALTLAPIDVHLLCLQVLEELYPKARERSLTLQLNEPESGFEDITIDADGPKLARALRNLVRNAIAYADPKTTVEVTCSLEEDNARIAVTDQGAVIAPENLSKVFDQFYREDRARSAAQGGAGLGLAIAKEIVEAHGGSIAVQSAAGLTTFALTLPIKSSA